MGDLSELEFGPKMCPYAPKGCEWVGTYHCEDCDSNPKNYVLDDETRERFEREPWSVYCFTCGQFLHSRGGHPEGHIVATGFTEFKEKLPQFVMERLAGRDAEIGDCAM